MDDTPAKETPEKEFNKLDLSQLQGFSFGTQWTQDKASPGDSRDRSERPRREGGDRREGGGPERRDRRAFRKPSGGDFRGGSGSAGGPVPHPEGDAPARREFSGDRGPRREYQGGRREGYGGGPRQGGYGYGREQHEPRGPYESPYFNVAFYPEDSSFSALAKTIRSSCRTIELFEIARTVVGKNDRFVVVLTRKQPGASARGGAGETSGQAPAAKQPIYISVPDGIPFESEEAVVSHVLTNHLGRFFDLAEVEVDPPKGNFQVINKCGVTGELLGPPNYHRYSQIVQQHYNAKVGRMPFEAFRNRIETVRDPEVVAQWLEKMKKTTRYTWKVGTKPAAPASAPQSTVTAEGASAEAGAAAVAEVAAQEGSTTPEATPAITFDAFEDARSYLLTQAKEKVYRTVESARFHGKLVETMPQGEIRRAIEGALERQRRFPLDTANALRGRLRREHFTIFKKGSKGISYVCAVKRKFRVPGQTFAETISALIAFIEANPMVKASELPAKFLGIDLSAAPAAQAPTEAVPPTEAAAAAPVPAEASVAPAETQPAEPTASSEPAPEPASAPTPTSAGEPVLTIDQRARISRMQGDLRWLVTEGYVTEFIDGRLFAPPPMVEARKKEVEGEEHDPENFPEVPATPAPQPEASAPAPQAETPAAAPAEPEAPASAPETASETTPQASESAPVVEVPETTVPAPGQPEVAVPVQVVTSAEPVVTATPEAAPAPEEQKEEEDTPPAPPPAN
jgi:hypothetical protein